MKFYNAWYCPFAQRAWMALVHKEFEFETIEVDPYHNSDWWLKVSRGAGLVPVLVQDNRDGNGETTVVESSRILEYLDDVQPQQHSIFADDPLERAEQKYWIDHIGNKIIPFIYQFLKASEAGEQRDQSRDAMLAGLTSWIEAMDATGPFFGGEEVSAVDMALMPFAYRIEVLLGRYRDFSLPVKGDAWQRYHLWYNEMLKHPSFKATAFEQPDYEQRLIEQPDYEQRLIEHYLPYSVADG